MKGWGLKQQGHLCISRFNNLLVFFGTSFLVEHRTKHSINVSLVYQKEGASSRGGEMCA
jgi:hypothetical protein